jgi:4-hydroxy-3-methylbut-2-enyl diphosphate reductase IspH
MKMAMQSKKSERSGQVKIVTAKRAGFCFGVKRAIDISFDIAKEMPEGVYTLGPIIHNPQVIEKLKAEGIFPQISVTPGKIKALIYGHMGYLINYDAISSQGFRLIDATCPFGKRPALCPTAERKRVTGSDPGDSVTRGGRELSEKTS